jgi:hypothetical protein
MGQEANMFTGFFKQVSFIITFLRQAKHRRFVIFRLFISIG